MNEQKFNNLEVSIPLKIAFKLMREDYSSDSIIKLINYSNHKEYHILSVKEALEFQSLENAPVHAIGAWFRREEFVGYKYYVNEEWF